MKPITNLLLVLALVCYTFMAFYEFTFMGTISGLDFTAGKIQNGTSALSILYALTPYLTLFLAIGLNSLRNRYWGVAVTLLIVLCLYFFNHASGVNGASLMPLEHDPSAAGDTTLGEGYIVVALGKGFYTSCALTVLSLISALVSMMPLEFNMKLERSIDERIGKGLKHGKDKISRMGHEINLKRGPARNTPETQPGQNTSEHTPTPKAAVEHRHEDYMPPADNANVEQPLRQEEQPESDEVDHSPYMPK